MMPEQRDLALIAFLKKPDGGHRLIGISATCARLLGRIRHGRAKKREREHRLDSVFGARGTSCERAVW